MNGATIMNVRREEELRAGLHRANGVLNWRGVPDNHPVREQLHQFREIVSDLDRCFREASREQINALNAADDCVSRSMPELLRKQSEDDLIAHEAEILKALLETAKLHMHVWSALRTKIEGTYATLGGCVPAHRIRKSRTMTRRKTKSKSRSTIA